MSETRETSSQHKQEKPYRPALLYVLIGLVAGASLTGAALVTALPKMMIVTQESQLGFAETVAALEKAIPQEGWVVSGITDMNESMAKHGIEFGPRIKQVKLCKPEYAQNVLTTDRYVSTLMPCTIAVWEDDDGRVFLSRLNMSLLAKTFGGNIAQVMGHRVAQDERAILAGIVQD